MSARRNLKEPILELYNQGFDIKYITEKLKCGRTIFYYYTGSEATRQKYAQKSRERRANLHPYYAKCRMFQMIRTPKIRPKIIGNRRINKLYSKWHRYIGRNTMNSEFSLQDVIDKIGENPKCYLTGDIININKPSTYQFDHIIPKSRGGTNSLDNLGICIKQANLSKTDMTPDEYINLCKKVLEHQGYKVSKSK